MTTSRTVLAVLLLFSAAVAQLGVPLGAYVTLDSLGSAPRLFTDRSGVVLAAFRSGAMQEMGISRSTDQGASWSAPIILDPGHTAEDQTLATDGVGRWVAIWDTTGGPVKTSLSLDGGLTWSTPTPLFMAGVLGDMALVYDGAGTWMLSYQVGSLIYYSSSPDGLTWTPPVEHPVTIGGLGWNPRFVTDGEGKVLFAVLVILGSPSGVFVSETVDGGATWSARRLVPGIGGLNLSLSKVGNSCMLAGTTSSAYAAIKHSRDFGMTWESTVAIEPVTTSAGSSGDHWVVGDGAGNWLLFWSRGNTAQASRSTDDGVSWTFRQVVAPFANYIPGRPVSLGAGKFIGCIGYLDHFTTANWPVRTFTIDLCPLLGPVAAGTGEDFLLATTVNDLGCPYAGVKPAHGGDFVGIAFGSPASTFDGLHAAVLVQATRAGDLPPSPFPGIAVNPLAPPGVFVLHDGIVIQPGGTLTDFVMPFGLTGIDLVLQAFALTDAAANGIFASTPAHVIRGL